MQKVPKTDPVVFITSSYDGQPPDNADHFFEWLSSFKRQELKGTNYVVAVTHPSGDSHATFHQIPKAVDNFVREHGGNHLCDPDLADAAYSDMLRLRSLG
ncbi:hypothetical protein F5884DRAFT_685375 [Xylogone sp. PMI_703]|nr:hypothetical protein F5884DRAFT_685375 [Xylogone sp. PMI_703]